MLKIRSPKVRFTLVVLMLLGVCWLGYWIGTLSTRPKGKPFNVLDVQGARILDHQPANRFGNEDRGNSPSNQKVERLQNNQLDLPPRNNVVQSSLDVNKNTNENNLLGKQTVTTNKIPVRQSPLGESHSVYAAKDHMLQAIDDQERQALFDSIQKKVSSTPSEHAEIQKPQQPQDGVKITEKQPQGGIVAVGEQPQGGTKQVVGQPLSGVIPAEQQHEGGALRVGQQSEGGTIPTGQQLLRGAIPAGQQSQGGDIPAGQKSQGGTVPTGQQLLNGVLPARHQSQGGVIPAGQQGGVTLIGQQPQSWAIPAGQQPQGGAIPAGQQPQDGALPAKQQQQDKLSPVKPNFDPNDPHYSLLHAGEASRVHGRIHEKLKSMPDDVPTEAYILTASK